MKAHAILYPFRGQAMDTLSLRSWLAKQLGVAHVDEALWRALVELEYVASVEEDEEGRNWLLKAAHSMLRFGAARRDVGDEVVLRGSPAEKSAQGATPAAEREYRRLVALDDYVGAVEANSQEVRAFRAEYLQGRELSLDKAFEFVDSPASRSRTSPSSESIEAAVVKLLFVNRQLQLREISVFRGSVLDELRSSRGRTKRLGRGGGSRIRSHGR